VLACAVALPLAVASAGSVGGEDSADVHTFAPDPVRPSPYDDKARPEAVSDLPHARLRSRGGTPTPLPLDLGLSTAVRCGPDLSSPGGIRAQTCVLTQGEDTWARSYYGNATGDALDAVLSLMGPDGRTMQMHCAVGAEDGPGTCDTPRERTRGDLAAYTAVAEFAERSGQGPLLLRAGSNSPAQDSG
jgi:hypothetical protein